MPNESLKLEPCENTHFGLAVTRRLGARHHRAVVGTVELPQVQVRLSWTTFRLAYAAGAVIQPPNLTE